MADNMRRQEEYKGTNIGTIPKEWEVVKLRDKISLEYGKGLTEAQRKNGIFPVFGSNGIVGYHNSFLVKGPGIVVGRKGTIGAINWSGDNFWPIDTTYFVKVTGNDVNLRWLFYKLTSLTLSKLNMATGTPGLNRDLVYTQIIPLPTLPEQQKIAEILSTVDQVIEKVNEAIKKTQRLKNGLMQELLTKGIGHKEFKDTEIGRIPKEWEVMKLGEIIKYEKGKKPKKLFDREEKNTLPYLSAETLRTGAFTQWGTENRELIKVNNDNVILIWDGYYCGDSFIGFEGLLSSTMIKIEPKNQNLNKRFLFYFLKACFKELNTKISGMYLKHVNKFIFESQNLPFPPLHEQQKIAEILSAVDRRLELLRKRRERLERVKKGLMDDLLMGKVRMTSLM
jgi:type I restriction enzyme S subunit